MNTRIRTEVVCKCGYAWLTASKLPQVTCPSCGNKTPNTQDVLFVDDEEFVGDLEEEK